MDLADSLRTIRKRARSIVLCVLLALGASLAYTLLAQPVYSASIRLFISTTDAAGGSSSAYNGGLFSQQRAKSYADLVSTPALAQSVADQLGSGITPAQVAGAISASAVPDTVLLEVTVSGPRPKEAQAIANAVGRQFPLLVQELEKPPAGGVSPVKISLVQPAGLPTSPVSPDPVRNLGGALVLGLLLGVGIAVIRERLDNTVKDEGDVRALTDAPSLGRISFFPDADKSPLIVHEQPGSLRAEEFRHLRTNLRFVNTTGQVQAIVVTSSVPSEGKSTTVSNLAITLAEAGMRVALIEGDLRRPKVAEYLGLEGAVGLTNVLIGQLSLTDALQQWGDGNLTVLPSGPIPPNPSELLGSSAMADVIEKLRSDFDIVLIDAPPLLPVTDASILAGSTSGVVLIARAGVTKRDQLTKSFETLAVVQAPVLGFVVNAVQRSRKEEAYGGYYGYRAEDEKDTSRTATHARTVTPPRRDTTSTEYASGPVAAGRHDRTR